MEEKFKYTYNPKEEKKIREIVSKYEKVMDSNYSEIMRLNKEAERPVKRAFAVCLVLSILLFGTGLSLCLVLYQLIWGSIVGILGMACIGLSFRFRDRYMEKRRKEYAPKILALSKKQ